MRNLQHVCWVEKKRNKSSWQIKVNEGYRKSDLFNLTMSAARNYGFSGEVMRSRYQYNHEN